VLVLLLYGIGDMTIVVPLRETSIFIVNVKFVERLTVDSKKIVIGGVKERTEVVFTEGTIFTGLRFSVLTEE